MKKYLKSLNYIVIIGFIGLYLISAGASWAAFTYLSPSDPTGGSTDLTGLAKTRSQILEAPKTEECPINGGMFTKVEKDIWEERRPITAMVENHLDARPLSGLSKADVVYEAVAEGGITRLLPVFYCGAAGTDLRAAVIRSARVHFIKWAAEYGNEPIFLHWGGANSFCNECPGGVKPRGDTDPKANAYDLLVDLGWFRSGNDFDGQFNLGVPVLKRLQNRLGVGKDAIYEHQPTVFLDEAYLEADERGYGFKDSDGLVWNDGFREWAFADDNPSSSPDAANIKVTFWDNWEDYDVDWTYDAANNNYKRVNGGEPFVDWEFDNTQITAKNVVVQFIKEKGPVDKELHILYTIVDEGEALIFQNGTAIEGTWEKKTLNSRTIFYDSDKEEIQFVRGPIWIEGVPVGNDIVYN